MIRSLYCLPDCSLLTWSNSVLKENITERKREKKKVTQCCSSGALMKDWMPCERKFLGCRPCICICMYVYICVYMYIWVCMCVCIYIYIYIFFFLYM